MMNKRIVVALLIAIVIDLGWPMIAPIVPTWVVSVLFGYATFCVGYWITDMYRMLTD